jgi:hypothetical protein
MGREDKREIVFEQGCFLRLRSRSNAWKASHQKVLYHQKMIAKDEFYAIMTP